jgi:hypothetical protein
LFGRELSSSIQLLQLHPIFCHKTQKGDFVQSAWYPGLVSVGIMSSRIPASHWRELQGLIAFKVLEHFYEQGDSQKKKTLYDGIFKIYHGDVQSETVSFASLAFSGENPFSRLYERVDTATGHELHILSSLTREPTRGRREKKKRKMNPSLMLFSSQ